MRTRKIFTLIMAIMFTFMSFTAFRVAAETYQEDKDIQIAHLMTQITGLQAEVDRLTEEATVYEQIFLNLETANKQQVQVEEHYYSMWKMTQAAYDRLVVEVYDPATAYDLNHDGVIDTQDMQCLYDYIMMHS